MLPKNHTHTKKLTNKQTTKTPTPPSTTTRQFRRINNVNETFCQTKTKTPMCLGIFDDIELRIEFEKPCTETNMKLHAMSALKVSLRLRLGHHIDILERPPGIPTPICAVSHRVTPYDCPTVSVELLIRPPTASCNCAHAERKRFTLLPPWIYVHSYPYEVWLRIHT